MQLLLLFILGLVLFALAYRIYGGFIARRLDVDDRRATPAVEQADGVDYVPTPALVVFGHHFSSIAGAGPIVGPIIAGLAFGWAPALAWIVIGAIFFGGVHDFTTLMASMRHRGRTIAEICRDALGRKTHLVFLLFVLFSLIYVIIVFLDLTALGFAPKVTPETLKAAQQIRAAARGAGALHSGAENPLLSEQIRNELQELHRGGATTTASLLYIILAILFGLATQRFRLRLATATLIFVPLVFLSLWVGNIAPLTADRVPALLGSPKHFWSLILLIYCAVASVLPVWVLLQPRDYLSSFLLFACIVGGSVGLILSAFGGRVPIAYPAFRGWTDHSPGGLGALYPALFVTVACGAISGFHSMVASGTTARQTRRESDARLIGYGGMLTEGVLAMLALSTVMILSGKPAGQPVAVFAGGLGKYLRVLGLSENIARTFGLLAVTTFLLTTLDTCTRLARFVMQELFNIGSSLWNRVWTTALVLLVPLAFAFRTIGGKPAWQAIWPAFGASNQLLAALALLVVHGWLRREGRAATYVFVPMVFMFITTVTALGKLAWQHLYAISDPAGRSGLVGGVSAVLMVLALYVAISAILTQRRPASPTASSP